ncbi:hypothetical protein QR680_011705 [Steinernema hermaphroditum]|uniref:Uncharacterized protein n=1 Tax=Steinernema hermaphroditum TaxID=289476 RepID=A0AA39I0P1_9BILA|nr:hypothetical protein QR680_011705 [Steinernema hermaphroditum]
MDSIPYEFIDSVVRLLNDYEQCELLAGYWGKKRNFVRTLCVARLDATNGRMYLVDSNPKSMDDRQIVLSDDYNSWIQCVDDEFVPLNSEKFMAAITCPRTVRRGQLLELHGLMKGGTPEEDDPWKRFAVESAPFLDAVDGNFCVVWINNTIGYAKEIEAFFKRILKYQMPECVDIYGSDATQETVDLIFENCFSSKCTKLGLYPRGAIVTTEHLKTFFARWNTAPSEIRLDVTYPHVVTTSTLRDICGFDVEKKESEDCSQLCKLCEIFSNETKNVHIHKVEDRLEFDCMRK